MTIFKLNFMFTLLTLIIMILLALALLTLVERKVIGSLQLRKGPNITYAYGLSQPIADGLKLFTKEPIAPLSAFSPLYMFSPIMALTISILLWLPLPMPFPLLDLNIGMLFLMALSSLAVYSVLGAGWASTSMYSLMGAMRVVAQNISYEVTLGLIVLSLIIFSGNYTIQTLNISQEHTWFIFSSWPLAFMWFVSTLAETNRSPFDLVEGESELVSGFNTEYASAPFALFFLAEYANILLLSILSAIIFLGTKMYNKFPTFSSIILMAKAAFFSFMFLWIRATYPRFRYDQLMHLVWKNFLPITLAFMMWHISLPIASSGLPPQL